ncbi:MULTISPECIES: type VII secretion protein EccB [unclassified Streptomyces]|uniref:type VII secretion protein EccB n=1 Tax=unclassified Streptomyces TaxID=2593676 RepID=UPI0006F7CE9D|nr:MULTISPECIES: type VII secretion protein EccB [unclassified Streptomyces]KQX49514.1 type VII secretion protein EccB [Streptomyces sp. Root1304]KRA79133.1 type VII secretion protein EccB [Streptomyces sp. Root66D1]
MQSRKDQVQAHMFVMGRLVGGMLRQDPDAPESPVGRTNRGLAWGIGLGVVLVVGFLLFGMISPAGTKSWRTTNALIVQKETGTRYLYLDGRLRPVLNYASARLVSRTAPAPVIVSTESLRGEPHGTPIGIPGAPDTLPGPGDLEQGAWQVCAEPPLATGPDGSGRTARTSLRIGYATGGAFPGKREGVLVAGPDGSTYLLWGDHRMRIGGHGALQALGWSGTATVPVTAALLDSLPAGADLVAPEVDGRGTESGRIGGAPARVGQVFALSSPGTDRQYFLLEKAGLRPLTPLAAALVLGDDRTGRQAYRGGAPTALTLTADELTRRQAAAQGSPAGTSPAGKSPTGTSSAGTSPTASSTVPVDWPATPPPARAVAGSALCAQIQPEGLVPLVRLALVREAGTLPDPASGPGIAPACLPVDGIAVRPGGGALVQALGAGGGVRGTTTYLVTDVGVKYRLTDATSVERLGLKGGHAQAVPSRLLDMLPTGPRLDVAAALGGGSPASDANCG